MWHKWWAKASAGNVCGMLIYKKKPKNEFKCWSIKISKSRFKEDLVRNDLWIYGIFIRIIRYELVIYLDKKITMKIIMDVIIR